MGAFIIAAIIAVATIVVAGLVLFGSMMSDSPAASADAGRSALSVFICGMVVTALVVASHWMPHIGW